MEMLPLWLHIIIFFMQHQTGFSLLDNTTYHLCRQEESQLLLQLKQLVPPQEEYHIHERCPERPQNYYKPKFWNQSWDCCLWDGVTCDESTGHVIGLDLSCSALTGNIYSNSSLFRLTHLRKLNLAYNYFVGSEISFKFGRLNSLTHLNLSYSGFAGKIPLEFYHLSNLLSLDISSAPEDPTIDCDIKMLLGNMTKIRVLLLVYVNISSEIPMNMSSFLTHLDLTETGVRGKLPVSIFEKPNLQILRLYLNDDLRGSLPSLNRSNVYSIKELGLSWTSISGRLPDSIGFMKNLKYMRLSGCKFSGLIPESIGNITEITEIDFSSNEFSGHVPSTISNLRQLTLLDLSRNHLEGQIPDAFSDLQKLTALPLFSNYFVGLIPSSITNMSQLEGLDISSNALTGPFPSRAGPGLQKLSGINLSHNLIKGMIPSWLLTLPSLESLDLSSNRLTGQTGKFNCKRLTYLDLSNNQLNIDLESFSNLSEIGSLIISYNRFTNQFPDFLRNSPNLDWLDLSNNKIHGPIPRWFRSIRWNYLSYLNISTNFLTHAGYLPWQHLESLQYLDLHSNSLQDTFLSSVCNMSQLSILNLSSNKLSGKIPECIGNFSFSLWVLDLRRNEFHGTIPKTIGENKVANGLANLGLNNNHLEGPLPRSLVNCTSLEVLDLGNNIIHDTFPWWLETLPQLRILILKSNRFHGSIRPPVSNDSFSKLQIVDLSHNNFTGLLPEKLFSILQAMKNQDEAQTNDLYMGGDNYQYSVTLSVKGEDVELTRVLSIFTTLDLSSNNFQGHIPESLSHLSSLRLLNLSHNSISGSIPPAIGHLTKLEQLDLSSNQLTGGIPWTLTNLTFLEVLNLSHNQLVGRIPEGNQFPTFSNDSYVGNLGLCGVPLTRDCGNDKVPPSPVVVFQEGEDDSSFMMGFTWKAVVMGYGSGLVFGFIVGNAMISLGKPKWFVRIFNIEAANCLNRPKKRGRVPGGRSNL
ncbi:hypothetical protein Pfo_015204 [Paulownia fortunei]|nr:hypothetical protein Pfo_015204 [Paulownia fortunei]